MYIASAEIDKNSNYELFTLSVQSLLNFGILSKKTEKVSIRRAISIKTKPGLFLKLFSNFSSSNFEI